MKQEDIIRMAREADVNANANEPYRLAEETVAWLEHFAALVRAEALAQPEQEPVAWVDLLEQAEEVVRSKSLWKKYINGTPLANDIAVWMVTFAQEHATPPAAQEPLTRATIADARDYLSTNDKAMWVIGWNECIEAHNIKEQK